MALRGGSRVPFDFDGALDVARTLWSLAGEVDDAQRRRDADAVEAKAAWRGRFADEFSARISDERTSSTRVAERLREEAEGWAEAWQRAMNEQNRRNRAQAVTKERERRSNLEKFGDIFWGDDSEQQVADAESVKRPQPPYFSATAEEQRF